jgi:hypothetical protein
LMGTGRMMTVSRWPYEKELRIISMATRKLFIDSPRQIQATTLGREDNKNDGASRKSAVAICDQLLLLCSSGKVLVTTVRNPL